MTRFDDAMDGLGTCEDDTGFRFLTESGSEYEVAGDRVRRVNSQAGKRGDGDWQPLRAMFPAYPVVGSCVVLVMDSLRRFGGDDYGTPDWAADDVTTRRTTPVVAVHNESIEGRND